MNIYEGTLDVKKMSPEIKKVYHTQYGQISRCYYKKCKSYKDYGAKGIRVEYTVREFIGWYLENIKGKKFKKRHVGRIDHSKNYSLDNIELQEASDNVKERNNRLGNPGKTHRKVIAIVGNKKYKFDTKKEAAIFFKCNEKTIYNHCMNRSKSAFKYGIGIRDRQFKPKFIWG